MNTIRNVGLAAGVLLVLTAIFFIALTPAAPAAAQNTACYRPQGGASFVCGDGGSFVLLDGATLSLETGAAMNSDANATFGGTLAVTGDAALAAGLNLVPQTVISVTNGGVITPTGALQRLESAGNVTATLAAPSSGEMLVLFNSSNTTILIQDTTGQTLASDASLGQWDTLTLFGYGTSWVEVSRSNN